MKICIIGKGLTALILAKKLVEIGIQIDLIDEKKNHFVSASRTLAITEKNIKFLISSFPNITNNGYPVNEIKIYDERDQFNDLITFKTDKKVQFYMYEYNRALDYVNQTLKKEKKIKILKNKQNLFSKNFLEKYNLIIDTSLKNSYTKKIFYKKVTKDYLSKAFISIINHESTINNIARQVFTKYGPLAFLPISKNRTSIVFSLKNKENRNDVEIKNLINKYNNFYKIKSFAKIENFELKFSLIRKYYFKNILAFGDALHRIHPLAGQGFNMNLRDIQNLLNLIKQNLEIGLPLNELILKKFEKKMSYKNVIFATGIDFIYEFFMFENKLPNVISKKIFNIINNKKFLNISKEIANSGISI